MQKAQRRSFPKKDQGPARDQFKDSTECAAIRTLRQNSEGGVVDTDLNPVKKAFKSAQAKVKEIVAEICPNAPKWAGKTLVGVINRWVDELEELERSQVDDGSLPFPARGSVEGGVVRKHRGV